jgi:hypothetical protein
MFTCVQQPSGQIKLISQQSIYPAIALPAPPVTDAATQKSMMDSVVDTMPVDVFLSSFRESAAQLISSVYVSSLPLHPSLEQREQQPNHIEVFSIVNDGVIRTPLPEDIFTLVETQLSLLDEYLQSSGLLRTDTGDALLVNSILSILRSLQWEQSNFRQSFLVDFDRCLAAANAWARMSDTTDDLLKTLSQHYSHLSWNAAETKERLTDWDISVTLVCAEAEKLIDLYCQDSVHAVQYGAVYIMRTIQQSDIPRRLFSVEWEDELVHNEVAHRIVRTFDDYLTDTKACLETMFLFDKVVAALVRATVCFYVQCLLCKADRLRRRCHHCRGGGRQQDQKTVGKIKNRKKNRGNRAWVEVEPFQNPNRAVIRMKYDIEVFSEYFKEITGHNVAMKRLVMNELSILTLLLEFMSYAAGGPASGTDSLEEFILVVHKRIGAEFITTLNFMSDIYVLMDRNIDQHLVVRKAVQSMQNDLARVTERVNEKRAALGVDFREHRSESLSSTTTEDDKSSCFRLDMMLKALYEERTMQADARSCGTLIDDVKSRAGDFHEQFERLKLMLGIE